MNIKIHAILEYKKREGLRKTFRKICAKSLRIILLQEKRNAKHQQEEYRKWINNNEPSVKDIEEQKLIKFEFSPKISIIVPMYNTPVNYIKELIESVEKQTYSNWELCLADGSEIENYEIKKLLNNEKIKYKFIGENNGISANSNIALSLSTGDFIALLDHDDILPQFALFEIVKCINENPTVEFIYSDEDKLINNERMDPHFKPDFAIDTLRSYNYICHFSVFKKELMEKLKGFNSEMDGSQDYDIILRASELTDNIIHIPKILYHWRVHKQSVAGSSDAKPYAYEAAKKAIAANLNRSGECGTVFDANIKGHYRIEYKLEGDPKVSIIILNKDHRKYLKKCIDSILLSTYKNYEIIIIENNSVKKATYKFYEKIKKQQNVKIIYTNEEEFNYSKLNNIGVKNSIGDYILFLNNDIKIITKNWLEQLISNCQRNSVGIVSAKLLYKNDKIQHAGVILGLGDVAGHINLLEKSDEPGYMGRINIQQNLMAVTGALLMISKKDYILVKGMDENLPISYNDIDLCLKIKTINKNIVYNPYIMAYHYESKTRGYDKNKLKKERLLKEGNYIKEKWEDFFSKPDPYFNINFRNDISKIVINSEKIKL